MYGWHVKRGYGGIVKAMDILLSLQLEVHTKVLLNESDSIMVA